MLRRLIAPLVFLLAVLALTGVRSNAQHIPALGGIPITAASGNVANASAIATLPAAAGRTTYLCGFTMTSSGSTGAAVVNPTVTGLSNGTLTYVYGTVAGATLANQSLIVNFPVCAAASAPNTTIVVTLPALGAGNTNAAVTAKGYQIAP